MARLTAGKLFRELMSRSDVVVMPGVFNAITAKLAARAGFEALYLSGAGVTNALTGLPDIGLLTLTEMAAQARYVSNAAGTPVSPMPIRGRVLCDAARRVFRSSSRLPWPRSVLNTRYRRKGACSC